MTLFEYVAAAASLVCTFAIARLLGGVAASMRPQRRYWVHALWVLNIILGICLAWWIFWSYRQVDWNFLRFLLALFPLATIYVVACLLIPADSESVSSWRQHYFEIRARFFALNLAYLATNFLNVVVLLDQSSQPYQQLGLFAVVGGLYLAGLLSGQPKLHAALVLTFTVCHLIGAALSMRPGSFGANP